MADLRVMTGASSPNYETKDKAWLAARALRDGSISIASFLAVMAIEGRCFEVSAGTGTAPATGAGAYVNTTPDVDISVPAGTVVIPYAVDVKFEAYGTDLLCEVVGAVGTGGVITPTSFDAITPRNLRLDAPYTSGCTAGSTGTGATYMTGNVVEFMRDGHRFAITKSASSATVAAFDQELYQWRATESGVWPIMYHPSSISRLNIFASSQAPTFFINVFYVELPGSFLS